jgi:N-acetylmuramic acid 6-phosphate etherase
MLDYKKASKDFIENEKQFHLGMIPTEQSNPRTRNLSATIKRDTAAGIQTILSADTDIPTVASKAFETPEFKRLVDDIKRVIDERKTLLFSSVGASGRMAIQLDAAWRYFWTSLIQKLPARKQEFMEISEVSNSFTTGGDRALVRSVENFEDYMTFGARQIIEAGVGPGDVVVGLAECGLSASINGSVIEADKQGCTTYYVYCNPKEILVKHLDRVRLVFERENIIKISLFVGNMAVSGSTRMQVTTVELLAVGAAIEVACARWLRENLTAEELEVVGLPALELQDYAKEFKKLVDTLSTGKALEGLAKAVEYETNTYKQKGLITYLTHDYLLDILTDTTERQPTFTLPPFKKFDDQEAEVSWAYVKDPLYPNSVAWQHVFRRPIKGLDWTKEDYIEMKASQDIINNPPKVASSEVEQYNIGNIDDPSRYSRKPAHLVCLDINGSATPEVMAWYNKYLPKFDGGIVIRMGNIPNNKLAENEIHIPVELPRTCTDLMTHLMVKLAFNLLSTGTMAKMGRVWGNWMIQVLPTNKKLIDRSTRIIASIANIPYEQANEEFFKSYYGRDPKEEYRESYVVETLKRLGFDPDADLE